MIGRENGPKRWHVRSVEFRLPVSRAARESKLSSPEHPNGLTI